MSESWASSPGVRSRMRLQKSADTKPELALRRELHSRGLRYGVHRRVVPGSARRQVDIVFPRARVAVFIDGCFWHGCPEHGSHRAKSNTWYWPDKIAGNIARDRDTDERLEAAGWTVLRFWEHDPVAEAATRVEQVVKASSTLT